MKKSLIIFLFLFFSAFYRAAAAPQNEVVIVTGAHQDIGHFNTVQQTMDMYEEQLRNHIELIEINPEIRYSMGNTYNTKYFVDRNPEYKQRLIKLMQEGKITTPALWVDYEPGWYTGEFSVRTVAYAKYWAMSTLNHTPHWAHLNDVPGITPQFAQILVKSGVYFYQTNPNRSKWIFPPESPAWFVGLDGSRVIVYSTNYDEMINFSDGDLATLVPFAKKISKIKKIMMTAIHDNGTDAPRSERLLEFINQWNQSYAAKYNCKVSMATAEDYALYLKKEVKDKNLTLPTLTGIASPWPWAGPYNQEYMAKHTWVENMLPMVEMFAVAAEQLGVGRYPHEEINSAWEAILWAPDHNWGDTFEEKVESARKGYDIMSGLLKSVLPNLAGAVRRDSGEGQLLVVFNPLNWKRNEMVEVTIVQKYNPTIDLLDSKGRKVPFQVLSSERAENLTHKVKLLFEARDIPGVGYRSYWVKSGTGRSDATTTLITGKDFIENEYYKIVADQQEQKIMVYDKINGVDLFDTEGKYRFGILDVYHWSGSLVSKMKIHKVTCIQRGPLRATLEVTGTYTNGLTISQKFSLDRGQDRIRQSIYVVKKRHQAKVHFFNYFPFDKEISRSMRLGIPYGSIPYYNHATHKQNVNFSSRSPKRGFAFLRDVRDRAAQSLGEAYDLQKWASFGDSAYTVDVAFENMQTRSFIKPGFMATLYSGYVSDFRGPWNFSIRGHRRNWKEANAPRFGWEVSHPLVCVVAPPEKKGKAVLPGQMSFWDVSSPEDNVVISALKKGFDNKGVVLRFSEILDQDTTVSVYPNPLLRIPTKEVSLTDMVEIPQKQLKKKIGGAYQVPVLGFGIETIKFFSRPVTDSLKLPPISDLRVIRGTSRTMELTWTAVGKKDIKEYAADYDLRYANRPVNSRNWDKAVRVKNLPAPAAPGQMQRFRLDRLTPHKTYFVSIRTLDKAGRISDLSNIVHFKTESRDRTPPARIKDLAVTDSGSTWVTLRWTASGDDGNNGIADRYDLRFFSSAIDKTVWRKKAIAIDVDLLPEKPGTSQLFTIVNLKPETKYYFTMVAVDEEKNSSPLSNPVFRKTGSLKKIAYQNGLSPSHNYQGNSDTTISRVNQEEEQVNYGDTKFLRTWVGGARIILVRFQKPALPPNTKIFKARLRLYCYDITYQDKGTAVCYRIKKDWKENEATWHFASKSRKWPATGRGILNTATDYGFGPNGIVDRAKVADGGGWVEFDVKKALTGKTGETDFGFAIEGRCFTDCGIYYYSSEFKDDPSKRPVLEIFY